MSAPYDDQRQPGSEPTDPWAEDELARQQAEQDRLAQQDRWVSESGGMGPIPSRTWRRYSAPLSKTCCTSPRPA